MRSVRTEVLSRESLYCYYYTLSDGDGDGGVSLETRRAAFLAAFRASRARSCSARARSSAESEDGSSLNAARSSAL